MRMRADEMERLLRNYPQMEAIEENIWQAFYILCECFEKQGKLLLCGNGGSASDCEHIVGELMKEYQIKRKIPNDINRALREYGADEKMLENIVGALPAMSLTSHISFITAYCNDNDADYIFAQQLYALGNSKDVLWAISTSGNSINIIKAAIVAKAKGIKVIGMTGRSGGALKEYTDVLINVPSDCTARVQEMHIPVYHAICGMLEDCFFGELENR